MRSKFNKTLIIKTLLIALILLLYSFFMIKSVHCDSFPFFEFNIEDLKQTCFHHILNSYPTFSENQLINITVIDDIIKLPTCYYTENHALKHELIYKYLNSLNWTEIMEKCNYNLHDIYINVISDYKNFILSSENNEYNKTLAIKSLTEHLNKLNTIHNKRNYNDFLYLLIKNLNWSSYIQTTDFLTNNMVLLKKFAECKMFYMKTYINYDQIIKNMTYDIINIIKKLPINNTAELLKDLLTTYDIYYKTITPTEPNVDIITPAVLNSEEYSKELFKKKVTSILLTSMNYFNLTIDSNNISIYVTSLHIKILELKNITYTYVLTYCTIPLFIIIKLIFGW